MSGVEDKTDNSVCLTSECSQQLDITWRCVRVPQQPLLVCGLVLQSYVILNMLLIEHEATKNCPIWYTQISLGFIDGMSREQSI
jgi:hypothetical protein